MTIKKETIWNIVLIVSIFLIITGVPDVGDKDKKAARVAQDQTALGTVGVIASFIGKKQVAVAAAPLIPAFVWVWGTIVTVVALIPGLFENFLNIGKTAAIPGWIWIVGFLILILMVLKKK